jgi:hypothetical protein
MSHADAPHREPPPRDSEPSSSRDQRIEQLLLAGLDRYFAGELERAIQVWSRVFFLDRGHPRARAYIDRARGAIAERQREAEARGHRAEGVASVFGDVDGVTARPAELGDSPASDPFAARQSQVLVNAATTSAAGPLAGTALAASAPIELEDTAALPDIDAARTILVDEPHRRARTIAQALLVALAALLLFGAGYVVAARDRLAGWWAPAGEPVLAVPAMAPESGAAPQAHEPSPGSSTPPRGTATR